MQAVSCGISSSPYVVLTRPEGRNGSVPQRLRALGMAVSELPALALQPVTPPAPLPLPGRYDVVVFVSRYAVQRYLELLSEVQGHRPAWPVQTVAATVGASSARALAEAGISLSSIIHPPADTVAQDSEALLAQLEARGVTMRRVLIVRGTQGREWLGGELRRAGVRVDFLPVYARVPALWKADLTATLMRALSQDACQCIFLLTSSEGVQAIAARLRESGQLAAWARADFIVIHERIGATLQSILASQLPAGTLRLTSCLPDDDSIVQAIRAVAGPTAKP